MKNKQKIKILIVDDHELYLDGLKGFFTGNDTYEIAGEANNGEELMKQAIRLEPHVLLTDLKMPVMSGPKAIRELLKINPHIKCIVLTSYDNEHLIVEALEAGAMGYITKNMVKTELFEALNQVCRGMPYFCRTTSAKLIRLVAKSYFNPYTREKQFLFSTTEKKIIEYVCEEKSNQEIAELLNLSVRTVENNRSRILKKMHVKTPAGIAIYAIKHGMYFPEE